MSAAVVYAVLAYLLARDIILHVAAGLKDKRAKEHPTARQAKAGERQ